MRIADKNTYQESVWSHLSIPCMSLTDTVEFSPLVRLLLTPTSLAKMFLAPCQTHSVSARGKVRVTCGTHVKEWDVLMPRFSTRRPKDISNRAKSSKNARADD